jgi:hypothetical protein
VSHSFSPDASLERLMGLLEAHNPNLLELLQAETEDQFMVATEGALDRALATIESGAKQYTALDERGLSKLLSDLLNMAGYHATAERYINGHVDVVIEHAFGGRWKYLGECKIHRGFQYHVDGCAQVLGYCTGRERRAFALDFFHSTGMLTKLAKLRDQMDAEKPLSQVCQSEDHSIKGAFLTSHTHRSGANVELLHAGCSLSAPS